MVNRCMVCTDNEGVGRKESQLFVCTYPCCEECRNREAEPYEMLVQRLSMMGDNWEMLVNQNDSDIPYTAIIEDTLSVMGVTTDILRKDVDKEIDFTYEQQMIEESFDFALDALISDESVK